MAVSVAGATLDRKRSEMSLRRFPAQRTAVVTGGGSPRGIGRALAGRLSEHGWSVAVLDIDGDATSAAAESLAHDGCPAAGYQVDIASQQAVPEVARRVEQELPPVVGRANVAGVASPVPFLELTEQERDRVFDINAKGQFFVTYVTGATYNVNGGLIID